MISSCIRLNRNDVCLRDSCGHGSAGGDIPSATTTTCGTAPTNTHHPGRAHERVERRARLEGLHHIAPVPVVGRLVVHDVETDGQHQGQQNDAHHDQAGVQARHNARRAFGMLVAIDQRIGTVSVDAVVADAVEIGANAIILVQAVVPIDRYQRGDAAALVLAIEAVVVVAHRRLLGRHRRPRLVAIAIARVAIVVVRIASSTATNRKWPLAPAGTIAVGHQSRGKVRHFGATHLQAGIASCAAAFLRHTLVHPAVGCLVGYWTLGEQGRSVVHSFEGGRVRRSGRVMQTVLGMMLLRSRRW